MRRPKAPAPRLSREDMAGAIESIREGYERFLSRTVEPGAHDDPKAFTAHHAAGRSALNHLDQLLKMTESGDASADAFDDALSKARTALRADRDGESDDDGDDP